MSNDLLRVYHDPDEIGLDGYPYAWHKGRPAFEGFDAIPAIKDLVREQADHRCIRCQHPFVVGETPGRWSPCDERCVHGLPLRVLRPGDEPLSLVHETGLGKHRPAGALAATSSPHGHIVEAEWRVLTVHHLNGIKHDCRWFNLVSLCQRCHLLIQAKVHMQRRWHREHSEWFKPYVAAFYAWDRLGEDLTREQTLSRLSELLALEDTQMEIE